MITCNLILGWIDIIVGYSGFVTFIVLQNYPSAIFGLITGLTSSICVWLHVLVRRDQLEDIYGPTELKHISLLSYLLMSVGILSLSYFVTTQILLKTPILPVASSRVISIVWAFLASQRSICLLYYSLKYKRQLESPDNRSALTRSLSENEDEDEQND